MRSRTDALEALAHVLAVRLSSAVAPGPAKPSPQFSVGPYGADKPLIGKEK